MADSKNQPRLILFPVLAILALFLFPIASSFSEAAGGAAWVIISSPNPSTVSVSNDILHAVAAVSDSNVWAVGSYSSSGGNNIYHTLAEHWNGAKWSIAKTVDVGPSGSEFLGVSASSSNDVWAVGVTNSSGTASADRTLIEHYDGKIWSAVSSPNPSDQGDVLNGVIALTTDDAWAVGYYLNTFYDTLDPLVLHWDGSAWSMFTSGVPIGSDYVLEGITSIPSSNLLWAVGEDAEGSTNFEMEFTGSSWSVAPSASFPSGGQEFISGVAGSSASDVWAVGSYVPTVSAEQQTLALHWNGKTWSQVATKNVDAYFNEFFGVAEVSVKDVWAVGYAYTTNGLNFDTLIEHWNGNAWSIVSSPNEKGTIANELRSVAVSTSTLWAVGTYDSQQKGNPGLRTLTERTTDG